MIYATELFFDAASEKAIQDIWTSFSEKSISTYMTDMGAKPHLTLGIFHDINEEAFTESLRAFTRQYSSFMMQFSSLGIFTSPKSCLFLAPVVTHKLLGLHTAFHEAFSSCDHEGWEYYLPNNWVPHCALDIALNSVGIEHSTSYMMDCFTPINATVESIGLVKVEKPVTYLSSFSLSSSG